MSDLEAILRRLDTLEARMNTLQGQVAGAIDLYRGIQVEDEGQIRQLADELRDLKRQLSRLE